MNLSAIFWIDTTRASFAFPLAATALKPFAVGKRGSFRRIPLVDSLKYQASPVGNLIFYVEKNPHH